MTFRDAWRQWHERRLAAVREPDGPLALVGTHWIEGTAALRIPDLPGEWRVGPDGVVLAASAADKITVDGQTLDGERRIRADVVERPSVVRRGRLSLVLILREGAHAVRVFDPVSARRQAFAGIDHYEPDPRWVFPATYTPFPVTETVRVPNADGKRLPAAVRIRRPLHLPVPAARQRAAGRRHRRREVRSGRCARLLAPGVAGSTSTT